MLVRNCSRPAGSSALARAEAGCLDAKTERSHRGRKKAQPNPDEEMRRTACGLIQVAIQAFMKLHGVDRETALRWIVTTAVEATQPPA
jgi:hypothetical protein